MDTPLPLLIYLTDVRTNGSGGLAKLARLRGFFPSAVWIPVDRDDRSIESRET